MQDLIFIEKLLNNFNISDFSDEKLKNILDLLHKIYKNTEEKKEKLKITILLNLLFFKIKDNKKYIETFLIYEEMFIKSILYYQAYFIRNINNDGNHNEYSEIYPYIINIDLNIAYLTQDIESFEIFDSFFYDYIDTKRIAIKLVVMSLMENLLLKFNDENERKLAHYTNLDVSNKIIKEETFLRLNSIEYVNDPSEGKILYEFLGIDDPINAHTIVKIDDKNSSLSKLNGTKIYHFIDDEQFMALACCFTLNHNSLNQFRLYGKTNSIECTGLSLVLGNNFFNDIYHTNKNFIKNFKEHKINLNELENFIENNLINKLNNKKSVYRCAYCDPKTKYIYLAKRNEYTFYQELNESKDANQINEIYIEYLNKIKIKEKNIRELLNILEELIKKILNHYDNDGELKESIYLLIQEIGLLFKHYAFQEEQECRITEHTNLRNKNLKSDFSINKIYIDYEVNVRENLKNIYLGKNIEKYLTYFKKELCDKNEVQIKVCEAPFN